MTASSRSPSWVLPIAGLVILVIGVVAVLLSQGGTSQSPSAATTSAAPSAAIDTPPTITGAPLPAFAATVGDPAIGLAAPVVGGNDYSGAPVAISPTGKPTMVVFAAHWCPHCQREVPLLQAWIAAGLAPTDVEVIAVSTGIEPTAPNYPPEAWFERVGWTAPIIVDPTNTVAQAYGLTSYPFFVVLDGTGKVFARLSGEIPVADLGTLLGTVPRT